MKELSHDIPHPDKTEIHAVKPDKREKVVYTLRPQPGQKTWQLDLKTRLIQEAEYEQVDAEITKMGAAIHKKVIIKEGCLYCVAINQQNADRKFMAMLGKKIKKQKKLKTKE